jgi:hypothetical protein
MKVHRFRITMIENQSTNEWDGGDEETVLASGADTLEEAYEVACSYYGFRLLNKHVEFHTKMAYFDHWVISHHPVHWSNEPLFVMPQTRRAIRAEMLAVMTDVAEALNANTEFTNMLVGIAKQRKIRDARSDLYLAEKKAAEDREKLQILEGN